MSAKVVSFVSEKGGVGKTTSCYHIAVGLQRYHKKKVLVIDADYQRGGITGRLVPKMREFFNQGQVPNNTLYSVFRSLYAASNSLPQLDILQSRKYNIDFVPGDPRLKEVTLDKLPGSNNIRDNNTKIFKHLSAISDVLEPLKDDYDYILIDTHPDMSDLTKSVIFACDYCVSPVKLDEQSTVGVASAMQAIEQVNDDCKILYQTLNLGTYKETKFIGALGMMAREYGEDLVSTLKTQYNRMKRTHSVFDNYVTEGDGIKAAAENSEAVFDTSGPNASKQSEQFISIIKEFIAKCK